MAKKVKRRDWAKEMFARPGSKENFFTLSGLAGRVFGGGKWRDPKLDISGAGKVDRTAPQIGAAGSVASKGVPDISGRSGARARSRSRVPDIGGSGGRGSDAPQIGAAGSKSGQAPDLGRPKGGRRKRKSPDLGTGRDRGVPALGGNAAGAPDISGAVGAQSRIKRGGRQASTVLGGRIARTVQATGRFRPLSDQEEDEFNLFIRRSMDAGHDVNNRTILSWKADVMIGRMQTEDLWLTDVGREIELRYGRKGEYLDLPEAERPKVGFIREEEETKEDGVRPSVRGVARQVGGRVGGSVWQGIKSALGR